MHCYPQASYYKLIFQTKRIAYLAYIPNQVTCTMKKGTLSTREAKHTRTLTNSFSAKTKHRINYTAKLAKLTASTFLKIHQKI